MASRGDLAELSGVGMGTRSELQGTEETLISIPNTEPELWLVPALAAPLPGYSALLLLTLRKSHPRAPIYPLPGNTSPALIWVPFCFPDPTHAMAAPGCRLCPTQACWMSLHFMSPGGGPEAGEPRLRTNGVLGVRDRTAF